MKLQAWVSTKKETLAQVFSCEFCLISKNTFSYRTPPVAASAITTNNITTTQHDVLEELNSSNILNAFNLTLTQLQYSVQFSSISLELGFRTEKD